MARAKLPPPASASVEVNLFGEVSYGERFLKDYVGPIASDPKVAISELIANASDAGARRVSVTWPKSAGSDPFSVTDDGTGMTQEQFLTRWSTLGYDRRKAQGGEFVEFPPGVKYKGQRRVFGQSGKGRFAPFCFADEYRVETTIGGVTTSATIGLPVSDTRPFTVADLTTTTTGRTHGTIISWKADTLGITEQRLTELITSVFMLDPQFTVELDGSVLDLASLDGIPKDTIDVKPYGQLIIYTIDTGDNRRHNRPGVSWRVNGRPVGEPGWDEYDATERFANGRPDDSKRFCFLIGADFLKKSVKPYWTGVYDGPAVVAARNAAFDQVTRTIRLLTKDSHAKRKSNAIVANQQAIRSLPLLSKAVVDGFLDDVQESCPGLTQKELNTTVRVLAKLEFARSGYDILEQLAALPPHDLDTWNALLKSWDASQANVVLDLVERRLKVVERLERISGISTTDEVHELLPLFGKGLWMFGPEYETAEFVANCGFAKVIRELLQQKPGANLPRTRPDIVAIPTGFILPFTLDGYDQNCEVGGIDKLLLVEIKKGGFTITQEDVNQASRYVRTLRKNGFLRPEATVSAYILGYDVSDEVGDSDISTGGFQKDRYFPKPYAEIVRKAHGRMFHLARKLRVISELTADDPASAGTLNGTGSK